MYENFEIIKKSYEDHIEIHKKIFKFMKEHSLLNSFINTLCTVISKFKIFCRIYFGKWKMYFLILNELITKSHVLS